MLTIREQKPGDDFGFAESSDRASSRKSSSVFAFNDSEINLRQIQQSTQRVRSTLSNKDADAAFKEYTKVKDHATLCRSLLRISTYTPLDNGQTNTLSTDGRGISRGSSLDVPYSPATMDTQSSSSGKSLSEVTTGQSCGQHSGPTRDNCLLAVRDWKKCIESLLQALELTLSETYTSYEPDATPSMVKSLFQDRDFRAAAIQQMRKTSIDKTFSASPDFFPRYIIRLRNYDRVKQDLVAITRILQLGESGVSDERAVKEHNVSPRGNAILEFANLGAESMPVLRFRVSSFLLSETSPIFERIFTEHAQVEIHDDEDMTDQLAHPPTPYICDDGTEARLYRMPQLEHDSEQALTILLHAAHMHNDKVPREISFEQFVAIAEVCLRYRCTSPLELVVEHRWLPQWIHKGSEDMPGGMLLISYTFGLRQLFMRMSKTAILNLVDEEELQSLPWPQKIKDKIWNLRVAKMAQVHACCVNTIQEYLRHPPSKAVEQGDAPNLSNGLSIPQVRTRSPSPGSSAHISTPIDPLVFSRSPRCPKGSHWCDATNLGWLMLAYGELQLLSTIIKPFVLGTLDNPQQTPRRSLAQLVDLLRTIASPPQVLHKGGVCDPTPQFRAAINDIYNSVSGLTLHDISRRAHGWALSRHRSKQPQAVLQGRPKHPGKVQDAKDCLTDELRLKILRSIDSVDDLCAAAMVNRGFYQTFQENELLLMRRFIKAHRRMTLAKLTSLAGVSLSEDKVPKKKADALKAEAEAIRDAEESFNIPEEDEDVECSETPAVQGTSLLEASLLVRSYEGAPGSDTPSPPVLSDEEAQRILWPASSISPRDRSPHNSVTKITAKSGIMREKFRTSDPAFVEEKMLLGKEDKQLREERDRRVGLVREDDE
ncbi:uncharacterized protein GLRG_11648 [Colletotrichum graminicola M1.001]|uniref:Uncharacterized protein n=1 Tax=Colletotrichum graminicola (strain M1.001 / M2 / FGSC 10212) TaxID=645133 RepID=E3R065_COLGM|nr:uncharacterized protein GLRG_11648 [Colletotrichum graminicola M1.001]EFQ36503.1 hypothetical protein GLRG_11648 [Colletotrichum graminicola M1.001]